MDPNGNWQDFFPDPAGIQTLIDQLENDNKLNSSFDSFRMFSNPNQSIYQSVERVYEKTPGFYYSEVLQLNHLNEEPDRVSIIFELARAFSQEKIAEGTELKRRERQHRCYTRLSFGRRNGLKSGKK